VHYIPGQVNFFLTKKRYKNGDSLGEPRLTWLTHDPGLPQRKEMKKEIESLRPNSLKSNDEIKKKKTKVKLGWSSKPTTLVMKPRWPYRRSKTNLEQNS